MNLNTNLGQRRPSDAYLDLDRPAGWAASPVLYSAGHFFYS